MNFCNRRPFLSTPAIKNLKQGSYIHLDVKWDQNCKPDVWKKMKILLFLPALWLACTWSSGKPSRPRASGSRLRSCSGTRPRNRRNTPKRSSRQASCKARGPLHRRSLSRSFWRYRRHCFHSLSLYLAPFSKFCWIISPENCHWKSKYFVQRSTSFFRWGFSIMTIRSSTNFETFEKFFSREISRTQSHKFVRAERNLKNLQNVAKY